MESRSCSVVCSQACLIYERILLFKSKFGSKCTISSKFSINNIQSVLYPIRLFQRQPTRIILKKLIFLQGNFYISLTHFLNDAFLKSQNAQFRATNTIYYDVGHPVYIFNMHKVHFELNNFIKCLNQQNNKLDQQK